MQLFQLFVIASVVMGSSHTIAKERIFEPLRRRMGGRDTWLGYLVCCPYCLSHWIAFVIVPLTGAYYVDVVALPSALHWLVSWLLSSIFVATMAAYLRVLFYVVDVAQGVLRRIEAVEEAELRKRKQST